MLFTVLLSIFLSAKVKKKPENQIKKQIFLQKCSDCPYLQQSWPVIMCKQKLLIFDSRKDKSTPHE